MAAQPKHFRITYNQVHNLIKRKAKEIAEFKPDVLLAIGGGGFVPARVLRTFLKNPETDTRVPIFSIGLSLYESIPGLTAEQIGSQVVKTQWLGPETRRSIVGKRVLVVDEVDDSRTTLQYALSELQKDVEEARQLLPEDKREGSKTQFAVFVVHNKLKPKLGSIPEDVSYFVGEEVEDLWLDYPWEASDIEEHDRLVLAQEDA
ncbi:PRTase-like protein [Russula aff. rugulosa BPL654]|nr:PRTase-like protein [Russula aff. rugulosa BPL654]